MMIKLENIGQMDNTELEDIYECKIKFADESIDGDQQS